MIWLTSGAIISSVPAFVTGRSSLKLMDKPKSASLSVPSPVNRIFSDLMSLCIMPCTIQQGGVDICAARLLQLAACSHAFGRALAYSCSEQGVAEVCCMPVIFVKDTSLLCQPLRITHIHMGLVRAASKQGEPCHASRPKLACKDVQSASLPYALLGSPCSSSTLRTDHHLHTPKSNMPSSVSCIYDCITASFIDQGSFSFTFLWVFLCRMGQLTSCKFLRKVDILRVFKGGEKIDDVLVGELAVYPDLPFYLHPRGFFWSEISIPAFLKALNKK